MLALAMISLPLSASALDVRVDENEAPSVKIFNADGVSFEYDDGDVISQQTIRGENGDVDQLLIHFVDPQSGERQRDAFVGIQLYSTAPVFEGASDEKDAIAQNLLEQLSKNLGERVKASKLSDELAEIGAIEGYQARLSGKDEDHYLRFFVTETATGYALVLEQRELEDKEAQRAVERLLNTLSFGG